MNNILSYTYFPRMHTAIAEWLACLVFLLPLPKRYRRPFTVLIAAAAFLLLMLTNTIGEQMEGFLWILFMFLGIAVMLLMIWLSCRITIRETLDVWAHAFLMAEYAASLEWLFNFYLINSGLLPQAFSYVPMAAVYLVVFSLCALEQKRGRQRFFETWQDTAASLVIVFTAFAVSNVSFMFRNTVFSESLGEGAIYARFLVDQAGVVLLYAHGLHSRVLHFRYEAAAMQNLLQKQYDEYKVFQANNEALHRICHDLKHQIRFIRAEKDGKKVEKYLSEMEETVKIHEAEVNTGNQVLDTLLTSKNLTCIEHQITMMIYADAGDLSFMDTMDICSIFGNAVDNAIECEEKVDDPNKRLIKITVHPQNQFMLIRIENYNDSPAQFTDGIPATTKADKQFHGYGIKSIRHAAAKYQGYVTLEQSENWFVLNALIPIPQDTSI